MSSTSDDSAHGRAHQACVSCRKQKRKCDKVLPACSLCTRLARPCDYRDAPSLASPLASPDDFIELRQKVQKLEARLQAKDAGIGNGVLPVSPRSSGFTVNTFPAIFFLDAEIYRETRFEIPRPTICVPEEVLELLKQGDIGAMLELYFSTIHKWLPVVSRKRMSLTLANPNACQGAELALLLLCMKLITQIPPEDSHLAQNKLYLIAKTFFTVVESSASMTIQLVQSALLLCAYEVGHGIYPAAFLTAGHCARLVYALGIHDRKDAPQMIKRSGSWVVQEEMRRVWWGTLLLDRYVNLGSRGHPLATEDPQRSDMLPADDTLWDQGEMTTSEPLYVSTPTSVRASPFARTCQATHLLGRLIRHLNDPNVEPSFRFTEAGQLHRTFAALASLLPDEFQASPDQFSTAFALVHGGMLHLYDPYACTESNKGQHTAEETEIQAIAISGLKSTAEEILGFSQHLQDCIGYDVAASSPLVSDCLYQAAATYAWLVYETGSPAMVLALQTLTESLKALDVRWKVAGKFNYCNNALLLLTHVGEYLKALDIAKETLYRGDANIPTQSRH